MGDRRRVVNKEGALPERVGVWHLDGAGGPLGGTETRNGDRTGAD